MKSVIAILLGTVLTFGASLSAGRLLTWLLATPLDWFLEFIAGAAIVSTLVFLITAAGLAHVGVFVGLSLLLIGLATALLRRLPRRTASMESFPRAWVIGFSIVYLGFGWIYLSQAMAPEISPDAAAYHVGLIARYFRDHGFSRMDTSFFASFPAAVEMLFLLAFSIGRHSAAAMVEFLFLLATPFGILSWARRAGHPVAGVVGALLFFAAPVVGRDGTVAYVDVATAAIAFALFYALYLWREHPSSQLLAIAGLIAGFGFAAKYTQMVGLLYGVGVLAVSLRARPRALARSAAIFAGCAALVAAPWLIKNTVYTGNPVAPFLTRWFPSPLIYPSSEAAFMERNRNLGNLTAMAFPLELTTRGVKLEGLIGPMLLLLPIALFGLRSPAGRQLLAALTIYLIPAFGNVSARLLIPPLLFACLALAVALERTPALAAVVVTLHAATCLPWVVNRYADKAWRIEGTNWSAALRWTPEQDYLRRFLPDYEIGEEVAKWVPEGQPVLTHAMSNTAYQPRELIVSWQSSLGALMFSYLDQVTCAGCRPTHRVAFRFPARPLKAVRLALVDCGDRLWAVSEFRVFSAGAEIPRTSRWRLRARPNPWDVQLAFDGSPITLWNAREFHPPRAFIEIRFPDSKDVDQVMADVPSDLAGCRMRVEGRTAAADWSAIEASVSDEKAEYPQRYRRAVVEELEGNGIRWLVTQDKDAFAMDLPEHRELWGATAIAYHRGYRLWRLE